MVNPMEFLLLASPSEETEILLISGSNGQTGLGLADISAGQHHITISDVLGCFSVESYTISEPDKINTNGVVTHNLCFGNSTGTIETTTKGGTGDFEYLWSNGTVNQRLSDLAAGEYILTVTDENLCISVDTFTITQPSFGTFIC
ncbi:MAG: SprB repeat-containing protein [Saprospiraceae bacterium]|nr:SprB repeat-containing protein [Saprospiraceae bacterium]